MVFHNILDHSGLVKPSVGQCGQFGPSLTNAVLDLDGKTLILDFEMDFLSKHGAAGAIPDSEAR